MQDNSTTPRNFNPTAVPGLSDEAREAVNAAFDAMSSWRVEAAKENEKHSQEVIEKMAAAARALGWPEQIVDAARAQLHGSHDGRLGGADQITKPDDGAVGDAVEAQILARRPAGGRLAACRLFRRGRGEPDAVLDAIRRAVAESLD